MKNRKILLPKGSLSRLASLANGFRTKREISESQWGISIGLTYQILFEMNDGIYPYLERAGIKKCKYEDKDET